MSGQHEQTACLLVDHLWAIGFVSRWKYQPLCLSEIGGPVAIQDILVELRAAPRSLHLIQVKAARFLTKQVNEEFERQQEFLQSKQFGFHVWTDKDVLGGQTPHTLKGLDRGRRSPPTADVIAQIGAEAKGCRTLGELLSKFDWDDVVAAAADLAFFLDVTQRMDENTLISASQSPEIYSYLFPDTSAPLSWWETLPEADIPGVAESSI